MLVSSQTFQVHCLYHTFLRRMIILGMPQQATVKILLSVLGFFMVYSASRAELDRWAYLNNGGSVVKLAMNEDGLYAITNDNTLLVLQKNGVFIQIDTAVADVDANNDAGLWVTKHDSLYFREGVSASNLTGNSWKQVTAQAKQVSSGRYGLLMVVDANSMLYARAGITSSDRFGSSWVFANSFDVVKMSCGSRFCALVNVTGTLSSSGLLKSTNSPTISEWTPIDSGVKAVSAYGHDTLWKIDSNGVIWKALHFDPNFPQVLWKRHGYTETFKEMAVTDKIQLAVNDNKFIKVLTGCPIFDFEENDITLWTINGNAFEKQPVVGQEVAYGRKSGKVGDRFIDTYSSRVSYDMNEGSANASQGDNRTGTLKSPLFQIRTDMLHFIVGGGSYPTNYVGLYVQNTEIRKSSGESTDRVGPNGLVRSSRHWWDVTGHKGACAYIKIIDQGRGMFGHTIFDDLRASPPCYKNIRVTLENFGHNGNVSVGQIVEFKLRLHGFYTSDTRKLIVNVSTPLNGDSPYIYILSINKHWAKCSSEFGWKAQRRSFPSSSRHWHTLSVTIGNYLLFDVTLKIAIRVHDQQELPIAKVKHTDWAVRLNFAGEYLHKVARQLKIQKFGNESATLAVHENIELGKQYFVGGSIRYFVRLRHHNLLSLQRARHIIVRVFLPPYITLTNVYGLNAKVGDQHFSPSPSQHAVLIPELLLDHSKLITFVLRIDGDPHWKRKNLQKIKGQILVDEISYCKRRECKNALGNGSKISTVVRNKVHNFEFSYKKGDLAASQSYNYSKISHNNGSVVIICGPYKQNGAGRCYYGNSSIWYKLNPILNYVSFYDKARKEIFGTTYLKSKIRLCGYNFESVHFLSDDQWEAASKQRHSILAPKIVLNSSALSEDVYKGGTLWNMWRCCK